MWRCSVIMGLKLGGEICTGDINLGLEKTSWKINLYKEISPWDLALGLSTPTLALRKWEKTSKGNMQWESSEEWGTTEKGEVHLKFFFQKRRCGEPSAKPFINNLVLDRGFVCSRAAPSLQSIESQPSTQGFVYFIYILLKKKKLKKKRK